jgi:hypothetical protein
VRRKVVLPTYPFQRQRYWVEPADSCVWQQPSVRWWIGVWSFQATKRRFLKKRSARRLCLFWPTTMFMERVVVPGACHLSLALSCAELFYQILLVGWRMFIFPQALVLMPGV